jgi:hypothetical protein
MSDIIYKLRILTWLLVEALVEWQKEIWQRDLDERYCCDGSACCCGGVTIGEMYRPPAGGSRHE